MKTDFAKNKDKNRMLNKKGFTLTEIVAVLAVIMILAGVMVPSVSEIMKKSKETSDLYTIGSMNKLIFMDKMTGHSHLSPTDSVNLCAKNEFDIKDVSFKSENCTIAWNKSGSDFVLINPITAKYHHSVKNNSGDSGEISDEAKVLYYVYTDPANIEERLSQGYSIYLSGSTCSRDFENIEVGLDVGENENIKKITYDTQKQQEVLFRTAGVDSRLEIDACNSAVEHHGSAGFVYVKNARNFKEYGEVSGALVVSSGNVTLDEDAQVDCVIVLGDGVIVNANNDPDLKVFVLDGTESVVVNKVATSNIIPFEKGALSDDFIAAAGGIGTKESPLPVFNEQSLADLTSLISSEKDSGKLSDDYKYYIKLKADAETSEDYLPTDCFAFDLCGRTLTVNNGDNSKINFVNFINGSVITKNDSAESDDHNHTFTITYHEHTCPKPGYTECVCSCGYTLRSYSSDVTGHNYVRTGDHKESTCTEKGYIEYKCSVCDDIYREIIPAHHAVEEGAKFHDNGPNHYQICSECKNHFNISPHVFTTVVKDGAHIRKCVFCNFAEEPEHHIINEHIYYSDGTSHWHTCEICGAKVEAQNHDCGGSKLEFDESGHWGVCAVCGAVTGATPHDYDDQYKSEGNYHWQVCKECGYESEKETHTVVEEKYDHNDNHHWHYCTKCGQVVRYHDHAWEYMYDGEKHWQQCRCDENEKKDVEKHSFDENEKCTVCGYENAAPTEDEQSSGGKGEVE